MKISRSFVCLANCLVPVLLFSGVAKGQATPNVTDEAKGIAQEKPSLILLESVAPGEKATPSVSFRFGPVDRIATPQQEHLFTLRNNGTKPFEIDHLQPTCYCLTMQAIHGEKLVHYTLKPQEEITVRVRMDFLRLKPGHQEKAVLVLPSDSPDPAALLNISADIIPEVTFSPSALDFGSKRPGQHEKFTLKTTMDARLLESGPPTIGCSDSGVEVFPLSTKGVAEPDGKNVTFTYTVSVSADSHWGLLNGWIFLTRGRLNSGQPRVLDDRSKILAAVLGGIAMPVSGEVVGKITAKPGKLDFGKVKAGDTAISRIELTVEDMALLESAKIESLSSEISVRLLLPVAGHTRTVEVSADTNRLNGSLNTQIVLTTAEGQRLIIPVSIAVNKAALTKP